MKQRPFKQVDVFTATPYRGNPLAVVLDGSGLSAEAMQHFTDWTNLSECTFVLPPTPEGRLPGRRLPGAHLLPGARAAVCRPPHAGQLPRLAGSRRHGPQANTWCRNAAWGW
jgi:hypothetical protein